MLHAAEQLRPFCLHALPALQHADESDEVAFDTYTHLVAEQSVTNSCLFAFAFPESFAMLALHASKAHRNTHSCSIRAAKV